MKYMRCPHCNYKNPDRASVCEKCQGMLPLGDPRCSDNEPLIGHSYTSERKDTTVRDYNARGRRFMLTFVVLAVMFVLGGAQIFYIGPKNGGLDPESHFLLTNGLLSLGYFAFAFLLGKTAQSVGLRFWPTFAGALVPPLVPGLLARMGRRRVWLPYVYLMGGCMGMFGLAIVFGDMPIVYGWITLLVLPFFIYCLFGAAVAELGPAMGYNHILSVLWVCVLPVVLYVMLLRFTLGFGWLDVPLAIDLRSLFASGEVKIVWPFSTINWMDFFTILTVLAASLSFVLWIKAVYANLCLPEEEA